MTQPTIPVPVVLLERLYRIANGDLDHTYFSGHYGRTHSIACDRCDALEAVRKVLDGTHA